MNACASFFRLIAILGLSWSSWCAGSPVVVSGPASLEVTFPAPLQTTDLSQPIFTGAEIVFKAVPGPYPVPYPTQLDVLLSATGYTGLGTTGPWYYQSAPDGGAVLRFYVWEDGGRQIFYREYVLQTNGTYEVYVRNREDTRVLYQAGSYQLFGYDDARSRSTATFSVSVEGEGADAADFQWYFDGMPLNNGVSSPFIWYYESIVPPGQTAVSGTRTATLSISNVTRLNAGDYYCVVTAPSGVVTSAVATLTVNGHPTRDLTPPTAQITIPEGSEFKGLDPVRVTFISGSATDDAGVGGISLLFGTNHYGPMAVGPRTDSMKDTLWGFNVNLEPGSNYVAVYAVDVYGNRSATNSRVLYYETNVQGAEIALRVEGQGGITALANGERLIVGMEYEIMAVPFAGSHFDRWSGSSQSRDPLLRFVAEPGLSFTAHFSTNPETQAGQQDRDGLLTFNSLSDTSYDFPIFGAEADERARLMITGPSVTLPTGWNANNNTPALRLDSSVASNYVITLSSIRAPFTLRSFDVVNVAGAFTLKDVETGASYTHDGSLGRVTLGPDFRRVKYVDLTVNGQVTLDNLEYKLLEHAPVARVRVWGELKLPPITAGGDTLLNYNPPPHLETPGSYQYPGYRGFWHYLLAPDANAIPFVLDASGSRDPDRNALKFSWSLSTGGNEGEFYPLTGGAVPRSSPLFKNRHDELMNSLQHELLLTVQDQYLTDRLWFGVVVLTPQDASAIMWDWLEQHYDSGNDRKGVVRTRLIPILQRAELQFAAGQMQAGRRSLKEFERLANTQLRRLDKRVAETMLAFSRAVLEVTRKAGPPVSEW